MLYNQCNILYTSSDEDMCKYYIPQVECLKWHNYRVSAVTESEAVLAGGSVEIYHLWRSLTEEKNKAAGARGLMY